MNRQSRIWALVAVLVLSIGLAACGGGSEAALAPTAAPTDTALPPTVVVPISTPTVAATSTPTPDEYTERGVDLAEEGKVEEAIAEFQAALQLDPDHAAAHANLGAAYSEQDKIPEAVAETEKAIGLDPEYALAYSNLCHLYNVQGQTEQALAACEKALSLDPDDPRTHVNQGVLYLGAQDYDHAISSFTRAIDLDPEHVGAHNNLGYAYLQKGDLEAAVAALEEALQLDPEFAKAWLNLGAAHWQSREFEPAIAEFQKAIRFQADYAQPHLNLGVVYRTLGQVGAAADEFELYLQLDPDSSQAAAVENEIAKLREQESALSAEYQDSFGNFRLRYPAGWDYQGGEPGSILFSPNPRAMVSPLFGVFSVPLIDHGDGVDLSGVTTAEELVAGTASEYNVDPQEMGTFLLAGQPALVSDWEQSIGNNRHVGKIGFFVYEGLGYVVTSLALPDEWDGFEEMGLAMLGSLTMVEPEVTAEYQGTGYSLRYPAGWAYEENGATTTLAPVAGMYPYEAPYVALMAGQEEIAQNLAVEGTFDRDSIVAAFVQQLDARAGEPVEQTVGGQPAVAVDFAAAVQGVDIEGTLVLLLDTPQPMAVIGAAPAPRWASFADTFAAMMSSMTTSGVAEAVPGIDMEDPASVLAAVFAAARTQDLSVLAGLCDPLGQNDDDTALICAITADHPDRDSFIAYFAKGTVAGEATIDGDRAEVPFLFGPEGDQEETMILVRREGKWYLAEF